MRLLIDRSQNKINTIMEFKANFKLEITDHERQLLNTYLSNGTIGSIQNIWAGGSLNKFISKSINCDKFYVYEILAVEKKVKEDIEKFNNYIKVAESYQGHEEINFK